MIGSKERYALLTGASSGIGYELAKLFAKDGKNIVVVARSRDKLEDLKKELENKHRTKVNVLVKDLSKPEAPQELSSELEKEHIEVDVLVNNAGYDIYGNFSETNLHEELEMLQVNITSLTCLTKLFLSKMLKNNSGKILNVSSLAAFVPVPKSSLYAASKSFVLSFSEALATELHGTGITVTCLCPGIVQTKFYERGNFPPHSKAMKMRKMDAAKVAQSSFSALKKGKTFVAPGLIYAIFAFSPRLSRSVARYMFSKATGE
jgi:hypothetical protein